MSEDDLSVLMEFLGFTQRWLRDGLTPAEKRLRRAGFIERVPGEGPLMYRISAKGMRVFQPECRLYDRT